ncbi:DEAD/DEAH box helicase family protein, partial [Gluconobacter albidus]
LRDHQKRVIWRIIAKGSTYMAHAVGSGKTFSMCAAVMEQKRLGLISKGMIVVPGHCLAQMAREFMMLYPNAQI